jgi:hypothetical protein
MKKIAFGLMAVAGLASSAWASTSAATVVATASFVNKASMNGIGDAANITATYTSTASASVNAVRVTGHLTDGGLGTWANEARVRLTPGAGNLFAGFDLGPATGTQAFAGTIPIGPTTMSVTPFSLAAGDVNFQWYESFNDGPGADSTWDDVSYEFLANTISNGSASLGALNNAGVPYNYAGSHVSGGLDFFTFTIGGVNSPTDYLNIRMSFGAVGGMTDTEIALYDSAGNLVWTDDDGGVGFSSQLSFGVGDPLSLPDLAAGTSGATLAAGGYTLVTAGYNTNFTPLMSNIVAGSDAGTYDLAITYSVPAPGALALLGLGGLVATRRRR